MKNTNDGKKSIGDIVNNIFNRIKNDDTQSAEALKHSKSYSLLLETYVTNTKESTKIKNILKCLFFVITMGTMVAIVFFFYYTLRYVISSFDKVKDINNISLEMILSMATIIFPSISSLIVAFIKIPEIIAKYLFNPQEDDNMNKIIKNIQDYDRDMFAMEHKVEEALMNNKIKSKELKDDDMKDSPKEQAK